MTSEGGKGVALVLGGRSGLLGQTLATLLRRSGYQVHITGRADCSPTDSAAMAELLDETRPDLLFNTIAYTQVDKAEEEEEKALELNRFLPALLGRLVAERRPEHSASGWPLRLIHFSTDFVFDGRKGSPYGVDDAPAPLNVYGSSKLAGEQALLQLDLPGCCVIRTAWLFGPGKKNFVSTILSLCGDRQSLGVVHDQTGSPTYTVDLAAAAIRLAETGASGLFHVVNSGAASWAELAAEAVRLTQIECTIRPIPSSEYPRKAPRPAYSVLDCSRLTEVTGITPRPWPQALADYIYTDFATD